MRMSEVHLRNGSNPVADREKIRGSREQMHGGRERGQGGFIALRQLISAAVLENPLWVGVVLQMAELSLLCNEMPRWRYLELRLIKL